MAEWKPGRIGAPVAPGTGHGLSSDSVVPARAVELPSYLERADGQIYCVRHMARSERRGAVLVCGPFGAERERAYASMVAWARTLAAGGFDVLRFDYRGIGESSGRFEDMTVSRWRDDAESCAAQLLESMGDGPLILQGVRLGGVIAAELFASGIGDGLLLWAPPGSAREHLHETMRHTLIAQRINDPGTPARTRQAQIEGLESGELVNVDGYFWSPELWRDAEQHPLTLPAADERRPWTALGTQRSAASLGSAKAAALKTVDAEDFWGTSSMSLVPRMDGFVRASLRWIDECAAWNARIG